MTQHARKLDPVFRILAGFMGIGWVAGSLYEGYSLAYIAIIAPVCIAFLYIAVTGNNPFPKIKDFLTSKK